MRKSWSFSRRIAIWFAATTSLLVGAVTCIGIWVAYEVVGERLDALAKEELEELRLSFALSEGTVADFQRIAETLQGQHSSTPMAWRVHDTRSDRTWSEAGPRDLLDVIGELEGGKASVDRQLRSGRVELAPGLTATLALDGSSQWDIVHAFAAASAAMIGITVLAASVIGWILSRKVSRQLARVAEAMRSLRSTNAPDLDAEGAPEEVRAVAEALAEMLTNIDEGIKKARLLTSGLAHELRSPIQNLLGTSEVALLRDRTKEEYRSALRHTVSEAREFGRVVDNLVLLCASNELRDHRSFERFELGHEVRLRLDRERQVAQEQGVALTIESPSPIECEGDREALLLALRNLVMNAIEWAGQGGKVHVKLESSTDEITFVVEDTGPGVPKAAREQIFEPFHQGPKTGKRRIGYGMGLALARSAIGSHGGQIVVGESVLGGASFRATFPRAEHAAAPDVDVA